MTGSGVTAPPLPATTAAMAATTAPAHGPSSAPTTHGPGPVYTPLPNAPSSAHGRLGGFSLVTTVSTPTGAGVPSAPATTTAAGAAFHSRTASGPTKAFKMESSVAQAATEYTKVGRFLVTAVKVVPATEWEASLRGRHKAKPRLTSAGSRRPTGSLGTSVGRPPHGSATLGGAHGPHHSPFPLPHAVHLPSTLHHVSSFLSTSSAATDSGASVGGAGTPGLHGHLGPGPGFAPGSSSAHHQPPVNLMQEYVDALQCISHAKEVIELLAREAIPGLAAHHPHPHHLSFTSGTHGAGTGGGSLPHGPLPTTVPPSGGAHPPVTSVISAASTPTTLSGSATYPGVRSVGGSGLPNLAMSGSGPQRAAAPLVPATPMGPPPSTPAGTAGPAQALSPFTSGPSRGGSEPSSKAMDKLEKEKRELQRKFKPMQERNEKCLQAIRVLVQKLERVGVDLPPDILQLLETE